MTLLIVIFKLFKTRYCKIEFIGSSQTLIDTNILLGMGSRDPQKIQHDINYFNEPINGHTYVLAADVSKGRGQDYSTFSVIDITEQPFKQVCTYRNNTISPLLFPDVIIRAAKTYNDALVIIENNDAGQVVCNAVYYEHEYENTFTTSTVKSNGIGVTMSQKVKRMGCSNLKDLIDLHDGTVSMPLQIIQKVLQGLIQEQFQKEVFQP